MTCRIHNSKTLMTNFRPIKTRYRTLAHLPHNICVSHTSLCRIRAVFLHIHIKIPLFFVVKTKNSLHTHNTQIYTFIFLTFILLSFLLFSTLQSSLVSHTKYVRLLLLSGSTPFGTPHLNNNSIYIRINSPCLTVSFNYTNKFSNRQPTKFHFFSYTHCYTLPQFLLLKCYYAPNIQLFEYYALSLPSYMYWYNMCCIPYTKYIIYAANSLSFS